MYVLFSQRQSCIYIPGLSWDLTPPSGLELVRSNGGDAENGHLLVTASGEVTERFLYKGSLIGRREKGLIFSAERLGSLGVQS